jgi:alkanesulfonate monooxygenase SsuD/methylene tetrahydromethanopterin reductase-like flavin-dependent oxidoreductase (luciferase family)
MLEISIDIEGQFGLTWPQWQRVVAEVEQLGFDGLFRSDHFTVYPQPPDDDALELMVSLAYLADHTQRLHFGPLVAPISIREPILLARQAAAIDDLSGGRLVLGVGAGWAQREHDMFGYELGDISTRMNRFAEALEVLTQLLHSDEPVTYTGQFYHLNDARLLARTQRTSGPPLLIPASGRKKGMPLVARYADLWNIPWRTPEEFRTLSQQLDEHLDLQGRPRNAVKRTLITMLIYGPTTAHLEAQLRPVRRFLPQLAETPLEEALSYLRVEWNALVGTADEIVEQIHAYAQAGVEELILEWFDLDNLEGLQAFAEDVLPHLKK